MDELNERMLEFAGFKLKPTTRSWGTMDWPDYSWHEPDGKVHRDECMLPDFPHSLDACFKWLLKPICDRFIASTSSYSDYQMVLIAFFTRWVADFVTNAAYHDKVEPELEALAFCRAVDGLLEEKWLSVPLTEEDRKIADCEALRDRISRESEV